MPDSKILQAERLIDQIADRFEAAWRAGQPARLEESLVEAPENCRTALFRELLAVELQLRRDRGEDPCPADYQARFAGYGDGILAAFELADDTGDIQQSTRAELSSYLSTATESQVCRRYGAEPGPERLPGVEAGACFGRFELIEELGEGGFGTVWKARDRVLKRLVALKIPRAGWLQSTKSEQAVKRFRREIKAAARLFHPNIVTAYDADEVKGVHFLVMEYAEGQDLAALVKERGILSVREAVDCILQAARGLDYAHRQGVIHRDIKPNNLLIDRTGTVKVLDMGLARIEEQIEALDCAANESLTQTGQVMGTLDFMPPEQILDTKTADARSDIYSLGCTLYYLLTGRSPYGGDTFTKKMLAHRSTQVPSLRQSLPEVPERLDEIFQKMLAKRPEDRQQTMGEIVSALEACLAEEKLDEKVTRHQETASFPATAAADTTPSGVPSLSEPERVVDRCPVQSIGRFLASSLSPPIAPVRKPQKQWKKYRTVLVGIGLAGVLGLLVLGIVVALRSPEGTLIVEVNEPGAKVQVLDAEGKVEIERMSNNEKLSFSMLPGKRQIRVEKEGFAFFAKKFTLEKRGESTVNVHLEPLPEEPATLQLAVGEPDAHVVPLRIIRSGSEPPPAVAPFDAKQARKHQEAWAEHLGVPVEWTNSIGMKFVLIPPGEFMMGSTEAEVEQMISDARAADEITWPIPFMPAQIPKHRVRITNAFYLGMFEVTQAEYLAVILSTESSSGSLPKRGMEPTQGSGLPMAGVTWQNAVEFCENLTDLERTEGNTVTYRLPTEAEWEYACRAGTTTRFYYGDDASLYGDYAWWQGNASRRSHPVGTKPPNPWGLYDMLGNVWEWVHDVAGDSHYSTSPIDDPTGPAGNTDGAHRYRGNSWMWKARHTLGTVSFRLSTNSDGSDIGFRVVASLASQ